VPREVRLIVERAGTAEVLRREQRGRVRADGAEAARLEPREVERTEASHRDAADGDAVRIGARTQQRRRDDLA